MAARSEIGQLELTRVRVNLRAQAAQTLEAMGLADKVTIHAPAEDAVALGDPGRIRQIIRNLVSNAIKYGGPTVHIQIRSGDSQAHLDVRDDGAGVPHKFEDQIFEPYKRAHQIEGVTESVGIGLSVARQLARAMGGDLNYLREQDQTTFRFTVPRYQEDGTDHHRYAKEEQFTA